MSDEKRYTEEEWQKEREKLEKAAFAGGRMTGIGICLALLVIGIGGVFLVSLLCNFSAGL